MNRSTRSLLLLGVLLGLFALSGTAAAGRYIVVLDDSVQKPGAVADLHAAKFGGQVGYVYRHALKGYSVTLPDAAVQELRGEPSVALVEGDGVMRASATQSNATWGLDRIDQRALPLSTTFTYTATGSGVTAYILDTGIRLTHTQFGGRAVWGYDAIGGGTLVGGDCHGHGTHVAGTVGGSTYGVAKSVRLVAVRVLDCAGFGLNSGVIAGVDWVTGNHGAGQPAVANMSLGGGASSALDTAVRNSIADGVSYAVAAGNETEDACTGSPSRVAEAMTIGATDKNDRKASFSDFGPCVDWFAPGVSITSAGFLTDTSTATMSGTSMASPHTAGVAALYLQGNPAATPSAVTGALSAATTKGIVTASSSANNHLLFTNY